MKSIKEKTVEELLSELLVTGDNNNLRTELLIKIAFLLEEQQETLKELLKESRWE